MRSVKWYEDWYQGTEHFVYKEELQRCCWSTLSVCLSRHVSPQVCFFHVNLHLNDDLSNPFSDCPRPPALQTPGTGSLRQESSGACGSGRIGRQLGTDFVLMLINVSLCNLNIYAKFLHLIHDSGLGLAKWRCATCGNLLMSTGK